MKLIYSAVMLVLFLLTSTVGEAQVSGGRIIHFSNVASKYVQPRNIDVWLPENYNPQKKYAVLYMHDGQSLFDTTTSFNHSEWKVDETMSKLMGEGKILPCIVVGIWNTGMTRRAEYFPQMALENLTGNERDDFMPMLEGGPMADNYLKFIVNELKPLIDSSFSTMKDRAHTFIAGSSMGGLISLYAICQHPSVFGGAACLSTHWIGSHKGNDNPVPFAIIRYVDAHLPSPKNHRIYFDYGSVSLDSMYKPYQSKVDEIMLKHGYSSPNWITREYVGESHTEEAWSKRFYIPVTFLLHK